MNLDELLDDLAKRIADRLQTTTRPTSSSARLLSVKQAATYLGRSPASIHRLISSGQLPAVRSDRRLFIDNNDLDLFVRRYKH